MSAVAEDKLKVYKTDHHIMISRPDHSLISVLHEGSLIRNGIQSYRLMSIVIMPSYISCPFDDLYMCFRNSWR